MPNRKEESKVQIGISGAVEMKKRWRIGKLLVTNMLLVAAVVCFLYDSVTAHVGHKKKATGLVIDAVTLEPISNTLIYQNGTEIFTDEKGHFPVTKLQSDLPIHVRASGYMRKTIYLKHTRVPISLHPFEARGLYLSFYGLGTRSIRESVLSVINQTDLNAVVIDIKGDRGYICYDNHMKKAREIGALRMPMVQDMSRLISDLHQRGIYVIGRIVVFRDNLLARYHPEFAVRCLDPGPLYVDYQGLAWTDPFNDKVRAYNIEIARRVAEAGIDEIQFDYIRFPDAPDRSQLLFSKPLLEKTRVEAINTFLADARHVLAPFNTFISADVYGYTLWNKNDTLIGQKIEEMAPHLDYICPMVYPSSFQHGLPGYRNSVAHPKEIVLLTLKNGNERLAGLRVQIRPWLQNFRDYAFDRRMFGAKGVALQIAGAEMAGSCGWLLWDPRNVYQGVADLERTNPQVDLCALLQMSTKGVYPDQRQEMWYPDRRTKIWERNWFTKHFIISDVVKELF